MVQTLHEVSHTGSEDFALKSISQSRKKVMDYNIMIFIKTSVDNLGSDNMSDLRVNVRYNSLPQTKCKVNISFQ